MSRGDFGGGYGSIGRNEERVSYGQPGYGRYQQEGIQYVNLEPHAWFVRNMPENAKVL